MYTGFVLQTQKYSNHNINVTINNSANNRLTQLIQEHLQILFGCKGKVDKKFIGIFQRVFRKQGLMWKTIEDLMSYPYRLFVFVEILFLRWLKIKEITLIVS